MIRTRHYGIYFKNLSKLIIVMLAILVVVFNVIKFCQYAESNDGFIVEYTPETDALKDFRTPLLLEMYFVEKYAEKKDLQMLLLQPDERFSEQQTQKLLLKKISPYKNKQIVFVFDDKNAEFADKFAEDTHLNPQKIIYNKKTFLPEHAVKAITGNNIILFICNDGDDEIRRLATDVAKQLNLRPRVLNLKYKLPVLPEQKNNTDASELTLDKQEANLQQFVSDYKNQLSILLNNILADKYDMPDYAASTQHLFDKGAIQVLAIDKKDNKKYQFGSVDDDAALARAFINGFSAAKDEKPEAEYKFYVLTKFVKKRYADEKDFLSEINEGTDGIMLVNGYRKAMFLPYFWNEYPDKHQFIKNLKINAGLSPDYWSKKIKIFYFRAVEVKYAD